MYKRQNEVRVMLLEGFTVYAEGPGFFGKKMEPLEAGAGSYEVEIEVKGVRLNQILRVREDPMKR